ncbi:hypothetical protein QM150_00575 [Klebsiella pneumoniae]
MNGGGGIAHRFGGVHRERHPGGEDTPPCHQRKPFLQNSILGSADEIALFQPVSSGGSVDAAYILATPEQIAYIKPPWVCISTAN